MSTTTYISTTTAVSSATATCTTATPDKYGRVPVDACNSNYFFDPSFAANLAFCVLFGMTTLVHLVQAILFKKVSASRACKNHQSLISHRGSAGLSLWVQPGKPSPSPSRRLEVTISKTSCTSLGVKSCSSFLPFVSHSRTLPPSSCC